jgi:hypothetical protein
MAGNRKEAPQDGLIQRLIQATGITEAQAVELINLLGSNWASLVREAKALLGRQSF